MIRLTVLCSLLFSVPTAGLAATANPGTAPNSAEPIKRIMHIRLTKIVTTIPITRVKGAIILPAMIAGKPVNLLFDNGSDASVIDTTLAQSLPRKFTKRNSTLPFCG